MGDEPREIERRGRELVMKKLRPRFDSEWLSEVSADLATRPKQKGIGSAAVDGRYLRVQLKYNERSFPSWLRYLRTSVNKKRGQYHGIAVLAVSSTVPGKACLVEVHQARPLSPTTFSVEQWTSWEDVFQSLERMHADGKGFDRPLLEYTTIASSSRLIEHAMREAFCEKIKGPTLLTPVPNSGEEFAAVDWLLKIKGRRAPVRIQEKVLKVKKKNGKSLGLRVGLTRSWANDGYCR
eukprot:g3742.t1